MSSQPDVSWEAGHRSHAAPPPLAGIQRHYASGFDWRSCNLDLPSRRLSLPLLEPPPFVALTPSGSEFHQLIVHKVLLPFVCLDSPGAESRLFNVPFLINGP